ncbi:sensor histidine kinase [Actinomadura vinacea]|uniref:sensor histidine kinase n=1 Tax=Actinomadura vinacea TaxID=115336 RepID=UPI0031D8C974
MDDPELSPLLIRRLDRRQLIGLDAFAALAYTFVMLALTARRDTHLAPPPAEFLVVLLTGPPLALRRRWPTQVFGLVLTMSITAIVLRLPGDSFLAAAYALYPVALATRRRRWIPTPLIGAVSGIVIIAAPVAGPPDGIVGRVGHTLLSLAAVGASWTIGRAVHERRAYAARTAHQLTEQAVTDERLRIARELHDVVAHSMSLIAVKAGVAVHVAEARPQEALDALRVIEATSRGALTEMRHLLGVLRTNPPPDANRAPRTLTEAELEPVPGLAGLHGLVDTAAMAGVRVDLHLKAGELPEGVALAVYRIVQEALTNVVKHAAPARSRVVIEQDEHEVRVEVTDDGPGARMLPGETPGHGLIGMRERAMMYGGELIAGPRPEGGFAVTARLPHDRSAS